jgi:hypothetical protein
MGGVFFLGDPHDNHRMRVTPVLLSLLLVVACTDASEPSANEAPRPSAATRTQPDSEPTHEDALGALLTFAREHRVLEPSTRAELEPLLAAALALVSRASGAEDLPRVRDAAGSHRVIELVRDAAFERVQGRILIADGSVRVDHAEDTLVIASDLAVVDTCRGCAVIAGRHAFVTDAAPDGAGTRSLVWSAGALALEDASGTVVAGPGAKDVAKRRGVVRADEKILGTTVLPPPASAPDLVVTREILEAGEPPAVLVRAASSQESERVRVGQSVTTAGEGAPWQLVQIFGMHVALRRGDDVVVLSISE